MSGRIALGEQTVGEGASVFLVAGAGVDHNGEPALVRALVEAALGREALAGE